MHPIFSILWSGNEAWCQERSWAGHLGWAAHCRWRLEEQQYQSWAEAEEGMLVDVSCGAGVLQTSPALAAAAQPPLQAPVTHHPWLIVGFFNETKVF